jgi:hypothetical protein
VAPPRGFAAHPGPGCLGHARVTARRSSAHMGLTSSTAGAAARHTGGRADLGIAADRRFGASRSAAGPASFGAGAQLGRPRARGFRAPARSRRTGACVGRACRARAVLGCATGAARDPCGCAARGPRAQRPSRACDALVGRRPGGSPRARVGNAGRFISIPDPDGAVLEPTGAGLECPGSLGICARGAPIGRLGSAAARVGGTTTDCRTIVERARVRVMGCTQDRGARGTCRAIMVGAGSAACRSGARRAAVESARTGSPCGCRAVVAAGVRRARTQLHRRRAGGGSRVSRASS